MKLQVFYNKSTTVQRNTGYLVLPSKISHKVPNHTPCRTNLMHQRLDTIPRRQYWIQRLEQRDFVSQFFDILLFFAPNLQWLPLDVCSYHTIPYRTVPYHTTPYHAILHAYHTTPRHATPRHATPRHATPRHAMPCHTIPYHNIPYYKVCNKFEYCIIWASLTINWFEIA